MLILGAFLLVGSLAMGILGLVKRGYELLVVIAMGFMLIAGFACIALGLLG